MLHVTQKRKSDHKTTESPHARSFCWTPLLGLFAAWSFALQTAALAGDNERQLQSTFVTSDGKVISSSAFARLLDRTGLTQNGKPAYQDLELVFQVCESGEFPARLAKLPGNVSIMTAADTKNCASTSDGTKIDKPGGPKKDVPGLQVGNEFYHSFTAQLARGLQDKKNTIGNKDLFAAANNGDIQPAQNPKYDSTGNVADNMTVHGGTSSNEALVVTTHGAKDPRAIVTGGLVDALKGAGYAAGDINQLSGSAATLGGLSKALQDLKKKLDSHKGEEKAYIFINAHGSLQETTVAYQSGGHGPGSGNVVTAFASTQQIFVDDPIVVANLQEDLPRSGGGFWRDDPTVQRAGLTYIEFTTMAESFTGPTDVGVSADGVALGIVRMGNPRGSDYFLGVTNTELDQLMPDILKDGLLTLDFSLPDTSDSFRFAVVEDWQQPDFPSLDYGLRIGTPVDSLLPAPEPTTTTFALPLLLLVLVRRRRQARRWY